MITQPEIIRFSLLRARVFSGIRKCFEDGGGGKSYEGTFEIVLPNWYHVNSPRAAEFYGSPPWVLRLHCYAFGPNRHYEWPGKTFAECLELAERDVTNWEQDDDAGSEYSVSRITEIVVRSEP